MFENIAIFITLVDCGSFGKAAEALKTSQPTISRKISILEQYINKVLIVRDTRNMTLTNSGIVLYNRFKNINSEFNDYIEEINKSPDGHKDKQLIVCLHGIISQKLICPYLKYYTKLFPHVDLKIIFYAIDVIYTIDYFDVGISARELNREGYIEKPIRKDLIKLYCTPQYITQFGRPNTLSELDSHNFIGYLNNQDSSFEEIKLVKFVNKYTEENFVYKTTQSHLKVNTALHSKLIGLASSHIFWCWESMCEEDVTSGLLVPVLPELYIENNNTFYLVHKENLSYEGSKFCDFLTKCMNKEFKAGVIYDIFAS